MQGGVTDSGFSIETGLTGEGLYGGAFGAEGRPNSTPYTPYPRLIGVKREDAARYGGLSMWVFKAAGVYIHELIAGADDVAELRDSLSVKRGCYSLTTYEDKGGLPIATGFYGPSQP